METLHFPEVLYKEEVAGSSPATPGVFVFGWVAGLAGRIQAKLVRRAGLARAHSHYRSIYLS